MTTTVSNLPAIPPGMVAVSKEQFFAALRADARDIMPFTEPDNWRISHWCSNDHARQPWGWSSNSKSYPIIRQYAVFPDALARLTGAQPC